MSEILPIHALKAQIIQHALDALEPAPATRSTRQNAVTRLSSNTGDGGQWSVLTMTGFTNE